MRFPPDILRKFVAELFHAAGVPSDDAETAAAIFVLQEMRGVRTHGLRHIPRNLRGLFDRRINPTPRRQLIRDQAATAVLDADNGLGMLACADAMRHAIDKARQFGIGIATVINSNHFLAAAPHALQAVDAGMIGIAFSNTQRSMGYPGAAGKVMGNGPFGFAAPTASGFPIVFDSAMAASMGKLMQWAAAGLPIPDDLPARDLAGIRTRDPRAVIDGGVTLPIGLHKGAGITLLIEILTGVLGGGAFLGGIIPMETRTSKTQGDSQCCIAIDIARFLPPPEFHARMAAVIADLKSRPLAPGSNEILVPGEQAHRSIQACNTQGVPLEPDVENALRDLAKRTGVSPPF